MEAGEVVVVYRGATRLGVATVSGNTWTFQDSGLASGSSYNYTARVEDAAGNQGTASAVGTLVVDNVAPAAPAAPTTYNDNSAPVIDANSTAAQTNDPTPGINVGAGLTDTPKLYVDGVLVASTYDPVAGTLTPNAPIANGAHTFTYTLSDGAGNESAQSGGLVIGIDTLAPATPATPTTYNDNSAPILNTASTAASSNDTTPGLNIPTGLVDTPKLYVNGVAVASTYDAATGTLTPVTPLADGNYSLTYSLVDAAGNESGQSGALLLNVDASPPPTPAAPTQYNDDVAGIINPTSSAPVTNDNRPGILVQAGLTETVKLYVDGVVVASTYDAATGTLTPAVAVTDGAHTFSYSITDAAGNESQRSGNLSLTIDTAAPATPVAPTQYHDNAAPVLNTNSTATSTNDTTPGIRIPAGLTEQPKLYVNGTLVAATYDAATGTLTPTTPLAEGNYAFTYSLTDAAGNESAQSGALNVTVDFSAPNQAISIVNYTDDVGSAQGTFASGVVTDDRRPVLNGTVGSTLLAGEEVRIYEGATLLGTATMSGNSWSFQLPSLGDNTTHTYTARIADASGNEGLATPGFVVNVDLDIIINTQSTLDTTPLITGYTGFALEPGEYIEVTVGGTTYSSQTGAVVIDPLNNTWYVQVPTALATGTYNVIATLKTATGTVVLTDATSGELIIAPAPAAPTLPSATDPNFKPTAVTLENGAWQIYTNGNLLEQTATNVTNFTQFSVNTLLNRNTQVMGAATFIDFDRDGDMDIVGVDNDFADGQQTFERKSFNGTMYQTKGMTGRDNKDWYGFQIGGAADMPDGQYADYNHATNDAYAAVVYTINGGMAAFDKVGDGYADMVVGDTAYGDGTAREGLDSSFVMNDRLMGGTAYFHQDNAYTSTGNAANQLQVAALTGVISNVNQDQLSGHVATADLDGNGTVDIVGSGGNIFRVQGYLNSVNTGTNDLIVIKNAGNGALNTSQIVQTVFTDTGAGYVLSSVTFADFDGDGDLDMFNAERGLLRNDNGSFNATAANALTGIQTSILAWTGMSNTHRGSVSVDWNGDGKMDLITTSDVGIAAKQMSYFQNTSTGANNFSFAAAQAWTNGTTVSKGVWSAGATPGSGRGFSGLIAADIDWDGDKDIMAFTTGAGTYYVENKDANINNGANTGVLHFRIVDQEGINSLFGNLVKLYDQATGQLVATQIINPQAGQQTNDSSALVSFYGLDQSKTYTVQLLRNIGGNAAHVGSGDFGGYNLTAIQAAWTTGVFYSNSAAGNGGQTATTGIGGINAAWGGLRTGNAWDATVLTAENGNGQFDANRGQGVLGTGYNDTFMASRGNDVYNGAGGSVIVSGSRVWLADGGIDVVDYKAAGNTAITVNLSNTGIQNTGYGNHRYVNIEGISGANGADTFTDNAADNVFNGRGGNDTFNLLNGGKDTLIYDLLTAADATGGNGHDQVFGFKVGTFEATPNADRIDLADLLIGYTADADGPAHYINGVATIDAGETIGAYLSVVRSGGNTTLMLDRDGAGGAYAPTALVTLNGVDVDLATLLANHQIVIGG
nr:Ig-like domain-containing protein [Brevundimonas pishanensis]